MQRTDCWLPEGEELGGLDGEGEGIEKGRSVVTGQSQDVQCGTGNTVSDVVLTVQGAGWPPEIAGGTH